MELRLQLPALPRSVVCASVHQGVAWQGNAPQPLCVAKPRLKDACCLTAVCPWKLGMVHGDSSSFLMLCLSSKLLL